MSTTRNIRLIIAYDGTDYSGWQVQPELRTIQGEVERAICAVSGEQVRLLSAGRTDSGVHAIGQVANFTTSSSILPEKWRPALQSHLPPDIVIRESLAVPPEFHATFSAISKRYRYVIRNDVVDDPLTRRFHWRISQPLDVAAMQSAAQVLLGRHDFRSFESNWPNKATSVRTILNISVQRFSAGAFPVASTLSDVFAPPAGESDGSMIVMEVEADGFLYNMVRTITGTLVNVGRGTWSRADVERVLHAQDRSVAGATAPARGLFLVQANYPEDLSIRQPRHDLG